jgi:hypothetical protein
VLISICEPRAAVVFIGSFNPDYPDEAVQMFSKASFKEEVVESTW